METIEIDGDELGPGVARFLSSKEPVAVVRLGKTVGFFIPTPPPSEEDIRALQAASQAVETLLTEQNLSEDELMADYEKMRKRAKARKKSPARSV